ncbi:MAG TPA: tRNA pseudouridine(13) synthase TruD, partial [Thermoplasmata archaeon]|nr:tRNA pseudouridine(13) synthase TruD [Thermoplasmata archaeon]
DFRVREISTYPRPDPDGPVTVLRVESAGWEQHELAAAIARRLALPARAIQWSGTKDRRAVSDRLFSYRGDPPDGDLGLPRVTVLEAYRARDGLVLGHHYGNAFEIRIGAIATPADAVAAYRGVEAELRAAAGFPNFFGPQRFGEVRPVTHAVGRALVQGDLAAAVDLYLTALPSGGSRGPGDDARADYAAHRDPARALREFPAEYRFERSILERLAAGDPPARALRALPHELRRLFVHAYQAYLFNRWLTARRAADLPLDRPVAGDGILRIGRDGTFRSGDEAPVDADNLAECSDLVARGRALVAGPLVGAETEIGTGPGADLLRSLLAEERVEPRRFLVPEAPELGSRGAARPILLPLPPIGLTAEASAVVFRFALPKGAYATILLREFLKLGAET